MFCLVAVLALVQSSASAQTCVASDCITGADAHALLQSNAKLRLQSAEDSNVDAVTTQLNQVMADVETMAAEDPPERNMSKVEDINKIVEKILMPNLKEQRKWAKEQLLEAHDAVAGCNEHSKGVMSDEVDPDKLQVDAAEETHAKCRKAQDGLKATFEDDCGKFERWLKALNFGDGGKEEPPETKELDEVSDFLKHMSELWVEFQELNHTCHVAREAHDTHHAKCIGYQETFESHFCEWRRELVDLDASNTNCYDTKKAAYDKLKKETEEEIVAWKAEYKSLKKISCFIQTWLSDNNTATVNTAKPPACEEMTVDPVAMEVSFSDYEPPSKYHVNLAPVESHPGTPDWYDRYQGMMFDNLENNCMDDEVEISGGNVEISGGN